MAAPTCPLVVTVLAPGLALVGTMLVAMVLALAGTAAFRRILRSVPLRSVLARRAGGRADAGRVVSAPRRRSSRSMAGLLRRAADGLGRTVVVVLHDGAHRPRS